MAQLRDDFEEFTETDTAIVAVGPENEVKFKSYWTQKDLPFIGLPDPTHSVLKLYGQEVKLFKFGRMPAMVIVDKSSQVRFVHYGHDMSDIPDNKDVLESLRTFNMEHKEL